MLCEQLHNINVVKKLLKLKAPSTDEWMVFVASDKWTKHSIAYRKSDNLQKWLVLTLCEIVTTVSCVLWLHDC